MYPQSCTIKSTLNLHGIISQRRESCASAWLRGAWSVEPTAEWWKIAYSESDHNIELRQRTGGRYTGSTISKQIPFSVHVIPLKEEQQATFSYLSCVEATHFMVEFIQDMLAEIVDKTTSITHRTKGQKRRTKVHPIFNSQNQNQTLLPEFARKVYAQRLLYDVLKVRLRSGELYIIDLAGAQYGHHEPVTPLKEYVDSRILDGVCTDEVCS